MLVLKQIKINDQSSNDFAKANSVLMFDLDKMLEVDCEFLKLEQNLVLKTNGCQISAKNLATFNLKINLINQVLKQANFLTFNFDLDLMVLKFYDAKTDDQIEFYYNFQIQVENEQDLKQVLWLIMILMQNNCDLNDLKTIWMSYFNQLLIDVNLNLKQSLGCYYNGQNLIIFWNEMQIRLTAAQIEDLFTKMMKNQPVAIKLLNNYWNGDRSDFKVLAKYNLSILTSINLAIIELLLNCHDILSGQWFRLDHHQNNFYQLNFNLKAVDITINFQAWNDINEDLLAKINLIIKTINQKINCLQLVFDLLNGQKMNLTILKWNFLKKSFYEQKVGNKGLEYKSSKRLKLDTLSYLNLSLRDLNNISTKKYLKLGLWWLNYLKDIHLYDAIKKNKIDFKKENFKGRKWYGYKNYWWKRYKINSKEIGGYSWPTDWFYYFNCHLNIDGSSLQLISYQRSIWSDDNDQKEKIYLLENMIECDDRFWKQLLKIKKWSGGD